MPKKRSKDDLRPAPRSLSSAPLLKTASGRRQAVFRAGNAAMVRAIRTSVVPCLGMAADSPEVEPSDPYSYLKIEITAIDVQEVHCTCGEPTPVDVRLAGDAFDDATVLQLDREYGPFAPGNHDLLLMRSERNNPMIVLPKEAFGLRDSPLAVTIVMAYKSPRGGTHFFDHSLILTLGRDDGRRKTNSSCFAPQTCFKGLAC